MRLIDADAHTDGRVDNDQIVIAAKYADKELDRSRWEGCDWCNTNIYVKVKKYLRPLFAPATYVGELRDKLEDLTGEAYVGVPKKYCPICGRPFTEEAWAELERRLTKNEP